MSNVWKSDPNMVWREPTATWDEPVYPDETDIQESLSPTDEEESYSDFVPSGSTSELKK